MSVCVPASMIVRMCAYIPVRVAACLLANLLTRWLARGLCGREVCTLKWIGFFYLLMFVGWLICSVSVLIYVYVLREV
jgi:hypothetical protein